MLHWILSRLARLFPTLWQFFEPLFRDAVRRQLEILLPIALRYVEAVEDSMGGLSKNGEQKRALAFDLIHRELLDREEEWVRNLATSTINLAIEIAVQNLKAAPVTEVA
ncbi:MAG TPA: hypothetical protein VNL74_05355 [Methylococcus sp.]|nr:hypothetical protein [Methylococcus sp.]